MRTIGDWTKIARAAIFISCLFVRRNSLAGVLEGWFACALANGVKNLYKTLSDDRGGGRAAGVTRTRLHKTDARIEGSPWAHPYLLQSREHGEAPTRNLYICMDQQ